MKNNRLFFFIPLLLLIFPVVVLFKKINFDYTITSKGVVYPAQEWVLSRSADGSLINTLKDNRYNSIKEYSVTEFQRGDLAHFVINEDIINKQLVRKGDTIGMMVSQNEKRRLIELQGELNRLKRLYAVHSTGDKPEQVAIALERLTLARIEYETLEKITARNRLMRERGHISEEENEISENKYNIARQNLLIAEGQYKATQSGSKQEELDYISANMDAITQQIGHIESLINAFIITSPINGRIIRQQGNIAGLDIIIRVADKDSYIVLVPFDVYNKKHLSEGQNISFSSPASKISFEGTIKSFDNSVQSIGGRQKIFVTAQVKPEYTDNDLYPNMLVDALVRSEKLSLMEWLSRLSDEIYNN